MVQLVNEDTWERTYSNYPGVLVVDFFADWCGPCRSLAPFMEELATEYTWLTVIKIDSDQSSDLATKFKIVSLPTIIFFVDGVEKERVTGANTGKIVQIVSSLRPATAK